MPDFDRIARLYRWLEYLSFGPSLERCRFHFLAEVSLHRRALIFGDGDGRFTARFLLSNPEIAVEAIDSSAGMLRLLRNRVARHGQSVSARLKTVHTDALRFNPEGPARDLIVSHFFLDCFSEDQLAVLLGRLKPHLSPGTTWLVSEFAIPENQPGRTLSRLVVSALYRAFQIFTGLQSRSLPRYAALFRRNGFTLTRQKTFLGGLLVSELWLFRAEATGQRHVAPRTSLAPIREATAKQMTMSIEVPGFRAYSMNSFPSPTSEPDSSPDPPRDPTIPLSGSAIPGIDPGFPIEPLPEPAPLT